jgi:hypothetical protein
MRSTGGKKTSFRHGPGAQDGDSGGGGGSRYRQACFVDFSREQSSLFFPFFFFFILECEEPSDLPKSLTRLRGAYAEKGCLRPQLWLLLQGEKLLSSSPFAPGALPPFQVWPRRLSR